AAPLPPAAPPSAPVIASVAPAIRQDLSPPPPLPPTRIAGIPATVETPRGPTLAWQAGPSGQGTAPGQEVGVAPMPPRRPGDTTVTEGIITAYAPLPPGRPGGLAESNPIPQPGPGTPHGLLAAVAAVERAKHPS